MRFLSKHFIALIFIITFNSLAQSNLELGGYSKYLFNTSKYPQLSERTYDHIFHNRINTKYFFDDSFSFVNEFRFRAFFGQSIEKIPDYSTLIRSHQPLLNLDWILWNKKNSIGYVELDRLYFDYNNNNFQLTLGRQRIAWGTSWVWNPTDLFNPLSILDFDHEEYPGSDALRFQYYTGTMSKTEIAIAPSKGDDKLTAAILISHNAYDYDFNLIAGVKQKRWIVGFSWAGDIANAGFRGEITVQQKLRELSNYNLTYSQFNLLPISQSKKNPVSIVLSGDYTFPNSFYIHTELFYNNLGKTSNTALFNVEAKELGFLSAARWSLFQEFSYNLSALMRGSLFTIFNPSDKSFVVVPSLSYSIITNLDLYLIALNFHGENYSEYGNFGSSLILRIKYSF